MNKNYKEERWARYCYYCEKLIREYTYSEMLFEEFTNDYKFCNKRCEFLYNLSGGDSNDKTN
jgi:hypothetical protein